MIIRGKFINQVGVPLPNVTVVIGKFQGTFSDNQGRFSIEAKPEDIIEFSHIGMKTIQAQAKDIQGEIVMEENVNTLDEITVKGKKKPSFFNPTLAISAGVLIFTAFLLWTNSKESSNLDYTEVQV